MSDISQISKPRSAVRLDGWDAIAHHLGVHKRTARAWHKDRGLPVHQLFGKGGRVYAFDAELDEWRDESDADVTGGSAEADIPERVPELPPATPPIETVSPFSLPQFNKTGRRVRVLVVAAVALSVVLSVALPVELSVESSVELFRQIGTQLWQQQPPAVAGRLLAKMTAEGGIPQFIRVGKGPCNAVLTPDGSRLFVVNCYEETASVIDTATERVSRVLAVGAQPETIAVDDRGKRLYIGNFWGGIRIFDVESGRPMGRIAIEGPISDIVVAPDSTLYVARRERGLAVVSPGDHRLTPIPVNAMPMYLALSPNGSRLYVSYQGKLPGGTLAHDAIDVYDTRAGAFVARISGPPRVGGRMALTPNGLLLADGADACFAVRYMDYRAECPAPPGSVFSLIRTADSRVIDTLGFSGEGAGAIAAFPDGLRAISANQTLHVIDTASLGTVESFPLPTVRRVLFSPDGKRAWAVIQEPGSVAVLDTDKGQCVSSPRGLVGWWPGDGTTDDVRGAGNNGRVVGTAGYAPGLVGQAFHFEGSGFISLGTLENLSIASPGFTAMAWVKFLGSGSEEAIFDRIGTGPKSPAGFSLTRTPDGKVRFLSTAGSQARASVVSGEAIPSSVWTHIAAVRAADSMSVYVNGVRVATENLQGSEWSDPAGGQVRIAALHDGTALLRGLVDEAQWYNRALGPGEIGAVVSARGAGVCEGQVPAGSPLRGS
jgi:YVTN family beta-propeller protein